MLLILPAPLRGRGRYCSPRVVEEELETQSDITNATSLISGRKRIQTHFGLSSKSKHFDTRVPSLSV